jgi:hypothetical protein
MLFEFDTLKDPLPSRTVLLGRLGLNILAALVLIGVALAVGMLGYHQIEKLSWIDSYLNAAMLLGGMGPVDVMKTDAGKLFSGTYAIACGIVFIVASGVVLAPLFHRVLHAIHADDDDDSAKTGDKS